MRFEQIIEPVFRVRCFIIFNEYPLFLMNPREETFWKTSRPRDIDNGRRFSLIFYGEFHLTMFIYRFSTKYFGLVPKIMSVLIRLGWTNDFQIYNCNCLWSKLSNQFKITIQIREFDEYEVDSFFFFPHIFRNMNEKYK